MTLTRNQSHFENEIKQALAHILHITTDKIPNALNTYFAYYKNGWSWLKSGSTKRGSSNENIKNWASNIFKDHKEKNCTLFLPTDSWNVRASGWGIAAWEIAIQWFQDCWNYTIDNTYYCNPLPINGVQNWCECTNSEFIPEEYHHKFVGCPERLRPEIPEFRHRR
jgi:hypothetical protein